MKNKNAVQTPKTAKKLKNASKRMMFDLDVQKCIQACTYQLI